MVIKESLSAEIYIEVFMNKIMYLQLASRYLKGKVRLASVTLFSLHLRMFEIF